MRHKTTIINPYLLKKKYPNLRINKACQKEGEFIVVFSSAYHQGFNHGFNIAEAVNFATVKWLDIFTKTSLKKCNCQRGNAHIDPVEFYLNIQNYAKRNNVSNN